jgi:ABC-type transporter MlaC component
MIDHPDFSEQDTSGDVNLVGLLIGFLAFGLILFAVLAIYGFSQAHQAKATLQASETAAANAAQKAQKAADAKAQLTANESPYRSYTAPGDFGSFVIYFPKNWSGYAQTNTSSSIQVNLALNPDFITATNGVPLDPVAARVKLVQELTPVATAPYAGLLKLGKLTQTNITVSGIQGTEITGAFPDNITVATVFLPVRGQTMLISCENAQYLPEYNLMLTQAKINP